MIVISIQWVGGINSRNETLYQISICNNAVSTINRTTHCMLLLNSQTNVSHPISPSPCLTLPYPTLDPTHFLMRTLQHKYQLEGCCLVHISWMLIRTCFLNITSLLAIHYSCLLDWIWANCLGLLYMFRCEYYNLYVNWDVYYSVSCLDLPFPYSNRTR